MAKNLEEYTLWSSHELLIKWIFNAWVILGLVQSQLITYWLNPIPVCMYLVAYGICRRLAQWPHICRFSCTATGACREPLGSARTFPNAHMSAEFFAPPPVHAEGLWDVVQKSFPMLKYLQIFLNGHRWWQRAVGIRRSSFQSSHVCRFFCNASGACRGPMGSAKVFRNA